VPDPSNDVLSAIGYRLTADEEVEPPAWGRRLGGMGRREEEEKRIEPYRLGRRSGVRRRLIGTYPSIEQKFL
jgi:hypothetical protein